MSATIICVRVYSRILQCIAVVACIPQPLARAFDQKTCAIQPFCHSAAPSTIFNDLPIVAAFHYCRVQQLSALNCILIRSDVIPIYGGSAEREFKAVETAETVETIERRPLSHNPLSLCRFHLFFHSAPCSNIPKCSPEHKTEPLDLAFSCFPVLFSSICNSSSVPHLLHEYTATPASA